jgi:hypothetical protein
MHNKRTFFLLNASQLLTVFAILVMAHIFTSLVVCIAQKKYGRKINPKKDNGFVSWCYLTYKGFRYNIWLRFCSVAYLKLAIWSYLQLYNFRNENWVETTSYGLSVFITIFSILFPLLLLLLSKCYDYKSAKFAIRFGGLFEPFKKDDFWAAHFPIILILRKLVFSVCFVGL